MLPKLAGLVFGIAMFTLLLSVIWPAEAEFTAPLFCSPPYHDPMVVSDTFHDSEGTSTNFTLYCVGPRGEFTDEGFLLPWLTLVAAHTTVAALIVLLVTALRRRTDEVPRDTGHIGTEL
ncbi:hypothetical protein ACFYTQ_36020 [Nocardia sp. NPDC004068]|uniref:hypothetical protein n=1 Tax=Nocardia sp. NPDC004068 TaxID=3364303 RepID=UPI0036A62EBB